MAGLGGTTSLYNRMGGGEWVTRVGLCPGSDLAKLEKGSAILVFASDLHEEAPIWWLRTKQAAERGVTLVVAGARKSRLDKFATHQVAYKFGDEEKALLEIFEGNSEITRSITNAENLVIFMGSDGLGLQQTTALAGSLAERLVKTHHFGKPNNGLIPVWPHANDQGAYELGLQPDINLAGAMSAAMGLYVLGADPASEPVLRNAIQKAGFVIVQDLFLSETAKLADVVLPAQAVAERDGTLVSGERRAQRYAAAIPAPGETRADYAITSALLQKTIGESLPPSAAELFDLFCQKETTFNSLSFEKLGITREQWPMVGRNEVYYGGTTYENTFGLGVTLPLATGEIGMPRKTQAPDAVKTVKGQWLVVPVTRLYDQSPKVQTSLLKDRSSGEPLSMHPADAEALKISAGGEVSLKLGELNYSVKVKVDSNQPQGIALLTRNSGITLPQPYATEITPLQENERGTL
jgi:NADH-quinone oxidoreductase subunit G